MYYIEQEIIVTTNTLNFKKGDKFIIKRIEWDYLFDHNDKSVHKFNVRPSFDNGDTVWDTHDQSTFVVYQIVGDQVHSITPVGSTDPSFLRGRPISRVRSGTPPQIAAPSAPHPDTERLDWLSQHMGEFVAYVQSVTPPPDARYVIDHLRTVVDDWVTWNSGTCPVRKNAVIEYKLRNGSQYTTRKPQGLVWWSRGGETNPYSIVAYREVKS